RGWINQARPARWLVPGMVSGLMIGMVGSVAYASIPSSSGVINACYMKTGGAISVIDSTQKCGSNQTSLNWNQMGSPGPAGATGPQGPAGVSGYEIVVGPESTVLASPNPNTLAATASCPAGKKALGGGVQTTGAGEPAGTQGIFRETRPLDDTTWQSKFSIPP